MGFRFRRSIKIAPGIKLNLSKSGVSTSLGGRGATVNLSKRGTRHTVGIPGTGLSYSSYTPHANAASSASSQSDPQTSGRSRGSNVAMGCGLFGAVVFLLALIGQCSSSTPGSSPEAEASATASDGTPIKREPPTGNAALYQPDDTVYVSASSLNGRSSPSTDSTVVTRLPRGQSASVVDRSGEWLKVMTTAGAVWIASGNVTSEAPSSNTRVLYAKPHKQSSRRGTYVDGTCPCSGSHICVGPRGGRYCITSGGNKRYGV